MREDSIRTTRREVLLGSGAALLGAMIGLPRTAVAHDETARKPVLRIAHLTDMHVQPERKADEWLARCLQHVQSQQRRPDVIFFGGDTIMDAFERPEDRTRLQWEIWQRVIKAECSLPVRYCIGNHDVWGWNKTKSGTTGEEARYGKQWATEVMGLNKPYHSFDLNGWHFIVLDSTYPHGNGYIAKLDEQQLEWFLTDLKDTPRDRPVGVMTHIPIFSIAAMVWVKPQPDETQSVSGSLMHVDGARIREAFAAHGNVRLALSGHLHLVDRCEFEGVMYLCNGAVSGGWWKGRHRDCNPGYALVDLFADGSVERHYVEYGWREA